MKTLSLAQNSLTKTQFWGTFVVISLCQPIAFCINYCCIQSIFIICCDMFKERLVRIIQLYSSRKYNNIFIICCTYILILFRRNLEIWFSLEKVSALKIVFQLLKKIIHAWYNVSKYGGLDRKDQTSCNIFLCYSCWRPCFVTEESKSFLLIHSIRCRCYAKMNVS